MRGHKQEAPTIPTAELETIEALLQQRALSPRVRERLEMVKARALGLELPMIARWSRCTVRTVDRWLRRYMKGGVAALADAPRTGRPREADATYRQLLGTVANTSPHDLGLDFECWTAARLASYLARQTGVALSPGWIRTLRAQQQRAEAQPEHAPAASKPQPEAVFRPQPVPMTDRIADHGPARPEGIQERENHRYRQTSAHMST